MTRNSANQFYRSYKIKVFENKVLGEKYGPKR
jgi:hypothetical protein